MAKRLNSRVPKLSRHKGTGQAVVRLEGRDHYCGRYGTAKAQQEYDRLIGLWLANGRSLPREDRGGDLTVERVLAAYWRHAKVIYRMDDGSPSSELACIRLAVSPLRRHYGHWPAADFGPRALVDLRDMICTVPTRRGRTPSRNTVNGYIRRIKAVFKWAVSREIAPPGAYEALRAVDGLRRGRSLARETHPVRPVDRDDVDAVIQQVSPEVGAMIELMWLTGMRVGEVVQMRFCDIDRGTHWEYRPPTHKTQHYGRERIVPLGPRARTLLAPFLLADQDGYVFSPVRAERRRLDERRVQAKAPSAPVRLEHRRASSPARPPGAMYSTDSVRRAIARACREAEIARWSPHQLRHAAGTRFRREGNLEAARVLLGHSSPVVTEEHYAEVDRLKAQELMSQLG